MKGLVVGTLACLAAAAAFAQAAERVTANAVSRDPSRFLEREIRVDNLGCFSADGATYKCTSYHGVYFVPKIIEPASAKTHLDDACGGIVEDEADPTCLFDVVLTPSTVSKGTGEIIRGDQSTSGPVWVIDAATARLLPHR